MADTKISALPASTTPLAGTEVLPIVQSGVTRQVSVANLTAGRAISATAVTASTGNFVVGTSGQGIDFSATPGTGTSELLADYEEGELTATMTPSTSGTITLDSNNNTLTYTKVGRMVTVTGYLLVSSVSVPVGHIDIPLPFAIGSGNKRRSSGALRVSGVLSVNVADFIVLCVNGQSTFRIELGAATSATSLSANQMIANSEVVVMVTYFV